MSESVYGLQVQFVQHNGTYMVISKEGGISKDQLNELELRMVQSNRIPLLLGLQAEQIDRQVKLIYNVTSLRLLSDLLLVEPIDLKQLCYVLHAILAALTGSAVYMLSEQGFVLDERFIFIGNDYTEIYVPYLPLQQIPEKNPIQHDTASLAVKLLDFVREDFDRSGVEQLRQLIVGVGNGTISNEQWKANLWTMLREMERKSELSADIIEFEENADAGTRKPKSNPVQVAKMEAAALKSDFVFDFMDEDIEEAAFYHPDKRSPNKKSLLLVAIPIVLIMAGLLFFGDELALPPQVVPAAIAVLLLAAYLFYKKRTGGEKRAAPPTRPHPLEGIPMKDPAGTHDNSVSQENPIDISHTAKPVKSSVPDDTGDAAERMADYYGKLGDKTMLLGDKNATVLLRQSDYAAKGTIMDTSAAQLSFQTDKTGREIAEIWGNRFVIGRGPTGVQYKLEQNGVSRIHLEIVRQGIEYYAKDAGSKNGTSLNKERMVPFRLYPLKDGDTMEILSTLIIFIRK